MGGSADGPSTSTAPGVLAAVEDSGGTGEGDGRSQLLLVHAQGSFRKVTFLNFKGSPFHEIDKTSNVTTKVKIVVFGGGGF